MSSALERAIDSLSDPAVSTADALRRLLVVSRRISADELSAWLRSELEGYRAGAEPPQYRDGSHLPIAIRFDGYGGTGATRRVSAIELPDELASVMGSVKFRQPVAELVALSGDPENDPQVQLPNIWLHRYRELAEEDRVPHMPGYIANHVAVTIPRTHLSGILDRIKSIALDLALNLEDVDPEAGAAGGPTVTSEPALQEAVSTHLTLIFAHQSTVSVASGEGATAVQLQAGDVAGLMQAARALLDEKAAAALSAALDTDGGEPAEATRSFLARVRAGGYGLAAGLSTNAAYDGLLLLIGAVFPGFS